MVRARLADDDGRLQNKSGTARRTLQSEGREDRERTGMTQQRELPYVLGTGACRHGQDGAPVHGKCCEVFLCLGN